MSEKTELPTPRRLREAREEGQVAHSKDLTETILVAGLFGYMLLDAEGIVRNLGDMILMPAGVLTMPFDKALETLLGALFRKGAEVLAPFIGIVIVLGIAAEWTQTGMLISWKALAPSGKKLDIVANAQNLFSAQNLFEFFKSTLKITLLSVVVYVLLRQSLPELVTLPQGGLTAVALATGALLRTMLIWVTLGYAVLAVFDFLWQKNHHIKQLKMTKDEVKRDHKEAEGDPHIKRKRKELHKELMNHKAAQNTRHASVVVTNPTHLAVALAFEKDFTPLPVVLAMGEGALAFEIARIARECGIPVMQNIPLARALVASAQIDHFIPTELIEPVAEVLRAVRHMKEEEAQ